MIVRGPQVFVSFTDFIVPWGLYIILQRQEQRIRRGSLPPTTKEETEPLLSTQSAATYASDHQGARPGVPVLEHFALPESVSSCTLRLVLPACPPARLPACIALPAFVLAERNHSLLVYLLPVLCTAVGAWAGLQAMDQRHSRDHPWQRLRCRNLPSDHAKSRGSVELPRRAMIDHGWQRVDSLDRQTVFNQSCERLYIMHTQSQTQIKCFDIHIHIHIVPV